MASAATSDHPVRWWVPGDWNAFFGLFTLVWGSVLPFGAFIVGSVSEH